MELKDFNINLNKMTIDKSSDDFASFKIFGDGTQEFSKELLNEIAILFRIAPQNLLEKIILYNIRRSNIKDYSRFHVFFNDDFPKKTLKGVHMANSDFELYINEQTLNKLSSLLKKLKAMARRDILLGALEKLELETVRNLVIISAVSLPKERLFIEGDDPLVYADVTKEPNMKYLKVLVDKYRELNGP